MDAHGLHRKLKHPNLIVEADASALIPNTYHSVTPNRQADESSPEGVAGVAPAASLLACQGPRLVLEAWVFPPSSSPGKYVEMAGLYLVEFGTFELLLCRRDVEQFVACRVIRPIPLLALESFSFPLLASPKLIQTVDFHTAFHSVFQLVLVIRRAILCLDLCRLPFARHLRQVDKLVLAPIREPHFSPAEKCRAFRLGPVVFLVYPMS